jgi:hypothetical protein
MTILVPALPVKVRKARFESMCPLCRYPVKPGQQIASCGGLWLHVGCFIGHRHNIDQPQPEGTAQ